MELEILKSISLGVSVFIVAILYSSVGHGGASGYLLILSFLSFSPLQMSSSALILNIFVAGISFYVFYKNGYFSLRFTLPFIVTSIPAAFIGGMLPISTSLYALLLGIILLFVAVRLVFEIQFADYISKSKSVSNNTTPNLWIVIPVGTLIGLLSGIIGIGGGILLSPLILLMGWADIKQAAATSACFILANSIAGLSARCIQTNMAFTLPQELFPYIFVAFVGGVIGSHMGANVFSTVRLKWILGIVLSAASAKLILSAI